MRDFGATMLAPYGSLWRECSYCGSIHPGDLRGYLESDIGHLEVADEKYGYPHKVYVSGLPNPHRGMVVCIGTKSSGQPIFGRAPATTMVKFYTVHFGDAKRAEALTSLLACFNKQIRHLHFESVDGRVSYARV
jgi:hypothetical protein